MQPHLNSNHTFLVASMKTTGVVQEYLEDQDPLSSMRGLQCSNIAGPSVLMLRGTITKAVNAITIAPHPSLRGLELLNDMSDDVSIFCSWNSVS